MRTATNPLTTGEVERLTGLSDSLISKAIDLGDLPGHRVPFSKHRRVYRADLAAWLRKHGVPVPTNLEIS